MNTTLTLLLPAAREAVRGRWIVGVGLALALVGELLIRFGGGGATTIVSLLDVALIVTPLASLVAGTIQVHHARELTELFLAQPIARGRLFVGLYVATALPLAAALTVGMLAPFAWHGLLGGTVLGIALATGFLSLIGSALAFAIALKAGDRVRAVGAALGAWLIGAVLWDGAILLLAMLVSGRAVESVLLIALALNPVDIARVLLLLGTDSAALFGYTGAVVQHTLGTSGGHLLLLTALALWLVLPLWYAARTFQHRDF